MPGSFLLQSLPANVPNLPLFAPLPSDPALPTATSPNYYRTTLYHLLQYCSQPLPQPLFCVPALMCPTTSNIQLDWTTTRCHTTSICPLSLATHSLLPRSCCTHSSHKELFFPGEEEASGARPSRAPVKNGLFSLPPNKRLAFRMVLPAFALHCPTYWFILFLESIMLWTGVR